MRRYRFDSATSPPHIAESMPDLDLTPDLTPEDLTELAQLLREALAADKFFLAPQYKRRKAILDKIVPPPVREPLPAPRRPGEPTWAERFKRNRRR